MPPFLGTNLISRVKPAATLLGQTQSPLSRIGVMPVFACETFGRGRTFAMSTDCTFAWGKLFESQWGEGDNRYYRKFWRNVIRWLAENSRASQNRLLVRTDQVIYRLDEPIEVVVEAYDEELKVTTDYRVTASLVDPQAEDSSAAASETTALQPGLFSQFGGSLYGGSIPCRLPPPRNETSRPPMQAVKLVVQAWEGEQEVATASIELQLLNDSKEWLRPQSRPEVLRGVAESGGGDLLTTEQQVSRLLRSFHSAPGDLIVHRLPLWDRSLIWVAIVGSLATEWTLRRRGIRSETN
jgi:hypothetical protein